ncbi:MAG: hypothetical protein WCP10_00970 [Desulfuromonadales bacterium]
MMRFRGISQQNRNTVPDGVRNPARPTVQPFTSFIDLKAGHAERAGKYVNKIV